MALTQPSGRNQDNYINGGRVYMEYVFYGQILVIQFVSPNVGLNHLFHNDAFLELALPSGFF